MRAVFALALVLLAMPYPMPAAGESLTGKVVGVIDGDTITVLVERQPIKVRLAEIDTPERGQSWARRATRAHCTARGYHAADAARPTRSPT